MKIHVHTSVLLCAVLVGCGTPRVWYAPGRPADAAETEQARARLAYTTMQMQQAPPDNPYAAGYLAGQAQQRNRFVHDWMEAHGYRLVPANQVPTNAPVKLGDHTD